MNTLLDAKPEILSSLKWLVLYTKSRHEKWIDADLKKRHFESFLPTRRIKKKWSDRTVTIEEPLFKSYLFVKTDFLHVADVLKTKGAVKFVATQGRPIPVDQKVVDSLKNIVNGEIAIDPFPYLRTGDRVYVASGVFKGVEGYIVRKNSKRCRLVISIDAIMASITIEVDSYLVEKV